MGVSAGIGERTANVGVLVFQFILGVGAVDDIADYRIAYGVDHVAKGDRNAAAVGTAEAEISGADGVRLIVGDQFVVDEKVIIASFAGKTEFTAGERSKLRVHGDELCNPGTVPAVGQLIVQLVAGAV